MKKLAPVVLLAVSFSGTASGESLNDFVSAGHLASFCASRDAGTTKAALTLADGQSVRGEVHCDASAVAVRSSGAAGLAGTSGSRQTLPLQASDVSHDAVATAGSIGESMREQDGHASSGRSNGAGNSEGASSFLECNGEWQSARPIR